VAGLWIILAASAVVFALYWIPARALPHVSIRALPLLAVLSLLAIPFVAISTGDDHRAIQRLGSVSAWSVALLVLDYVVPGAHLGRGGFSCGGAEVEPAAGSVRALAAGDAGCAVLAYTWDTGGGWWSARGRKTQT